MEPRGARSTVRRSANLSEDSETKGCLFCGREGDRSKEHLLRQQFKEYFPSEPGLVVLQPQPDGSIDFEQRPISQFDLQLNAICRACNQGWLNDLENDVLSMILTAGRDGTDLPNGDFENLGFWAVIRALLRTHMSPTGRAPLRFFREAFDRRQAPRGCFAHWAYSLTYVASAGAQQATLHVDGDYLALVSFGLGGMLFQVTIAGGSPLSHRLAISILKRPQLWFPTAFYWLAPAERSRRTLDPLDRQQAFAAINSFAIGIGRDVLTDEGTYLNPRSIIEPRFHEGLLMPALSRLVAKDSDLRGLPSGGGVTGRT